MEYPFFALVIVVLVLAISTVRGMSLYSPMVINALVWLLVFATGFVVGDAYYPIRDQAFIAWLIFFVGSSVIYFFLIPETASSSPPSPETTRRLPVDYAIVLLFLTAWLAHRIWVVGSSGPEHFFLNLRLSSNGLEGYEPLGFVARFYPVIFALFLFEHVHLHKGNRHLRLLLWTWMLLYAFATMGKFAVLTPVLAWVIVQGLAGRIKLYFFAPFAAAVFSSMMALHFIRAGEHDESTLGHLIGVYVYSPIVALGYMPTDSELPFGYYVLRFFYAIGHALGIADKPADVILSYVEVPVLTNVYTAMQPFFSDFGLLGVACGMIAFSGGVTVLYRAAQNNNPLGLMLYAGFAIGLVGQFFGDLLVAMVSGNLQLAICILLVHGLSRRVEHVS